MARAYIGLGANLGAPAAQLRAAVAALAGCGEVVAQSPLYRTMPMGPPQPEYCNAVCVLDTDLPPQDLMQRLLAIERAAGRVRDGSRWGARQLDLDLLHVEGVALDSEALRLPHPGIAQRNFVLVPLADVAPQLEVPGLGRIDALAAKAGREGLQPWQD